MNNQMSTENNPLHDVMKRGKKGFLLFWVMVLIVSVFCGLTRAGAFSGPLVEALFTWPLILISVAVFLLILKSWGNALIIGFIGVFFWLPFLHASFPETLGYLPARVDMSYFWPLLVGVIALIMILHIVFPSKRTRLWFDWVNNRRSSFHSTTSDSSSDFFENVVTFSGSEQILFTKQFKGGDIKVSFGSQELDLRNVIIEPDTNPTINVEVAFGECQMIVPPHWFLEVKAGAFMGEISVRRNLPLTPDSQRVLITGNCFMGAIAIK